MVLSLCNVSGPSASASAKSESSVSLHRSPSPVQVSRTYKIALEALSKHQNCSQCGICLGFFLYFISLLSSYLVILWFCTLVIFAEYRLNALLQVVHLFYKYCSVFCIYKFLV